MRAQKAGCQDGGDPAAASVRAQVGFGLVHGHAPSQDCAHDGLGFASGAPPGRAPYSLYCSLTPSEFETSAWGAVTGKNAA